ncbi:DUF3017 domain-containing protein [Streptacidiphilus carbonis]|uniref:DUF3017 domain-containing protein n=1 Tax=Streptacidiphilus carbonis TaxID=105422 RepID=UPI000A6F50C2|nr:DUF3017 domain-containing protein [Streptacidiphilus carbonis]
MPRAESGPERPAGPKHGAGLQHGAGPTETAAEQAAEVVAVAAAAVSPVSRRRADPTGGTFPPEGSAAAADRSHPVPVRQWPIVVVLTLVAVGLAVTALNAFRPGVITIGAGLLLGCALRIALPEVGMLAVRSRFTDVLVMGVLGVAIVVLALASEPNPVITLPFVNDIARFFGRAQG